MRVASGDLIKPVCSGVEECQFLDAYGSVKALFGYNAGDTLWYQSANVMTVDSNTGIELLNKLRIRNENLTIINIIQIFQWVVGV